MSYPTPSNVFLHLSGNISVFSLNDNEILSLAIVSLEEDIKLYDEYSSYFLINYPETSKMFKQMSILKNKNRKKLVELHKKKFGETLSITNQKKITNYFKR